MSTKIEDFLAGASDDPVARQAAIARATHQRLMICGAALVVTICAVTMNVMQTRGLRARGLTDIGAILLWLMVFRIGAKINALNVAEADSRAAKEMVARTLARNPEFSKVKTP